MTSLIFHADVNSAFLSCEASRRISLVEEDIRLIIGGDREKRIARPDFDTTRLLPKPLSLYREKIKQFQNIELRNQINDQIMKSLSEEEKESMVSVVYIWLRRIFNGVLSRIY